MSVPKPKYKCQAADPAVCPYHAPFIAMDVAAAKNDFAAFEVARGEAEKANADRERQRMEREFDSGVSLDGVSSKLKGLFGRKKPAPVAEPTPAAKPVHQLIPAESKIEGMEGLISTDMPESMLEELKLAGKYIKTDNILKEVTVNVMADGMVDIITEDESKYFYNHDLRYSRPSVAGFVPENETQAYVVRQFIDAIQDQKTAMFENSGLALSAFDKAHAEMYPDSDPANSSMNIVAGANEAEDSGILGNYDEGWLYAFTVGFEDAKKTSFASGDESVQKAELRKFIESRKSFWADKLASDSPTDFASGAADAWDNWLQEF